jgi:hypothetical protein
MFIAAGVADTVVDGFTGFVSFVLKHVPWVLEFKSKKLN